MTPGTAPEGAITESELAEALAELGVRINGNAYFPELARNIFGYVERHREPRHKPGSYEDAEGNLYFRVHGLNAWLRVMDDGMTEVRPDDWVERPLRKLVPAPSRDAIYATLANGIERENCDQLTGRICKLLEGGSDD